MIIHFACKETEKVFNHQYSEKFSLKLQEKALKKLYILHAAINLQDLKIPPANKLKKLKGKFKSLYSMRINQQWRLIFDWNNGLIAQVQIIDYH